MEVRNCSLVNLWQGIDCKNAAITMEKRMNRAQHESGWGTRLTNLRRNVDADGEVTNRFGERVTGRPKPAPEAPAQPRALKTRQGTIESPDLTAARLAEQKRVTDLKDAANRPKYVELADDDKLALIEEFLRRHRDPKRADFFYESPFNLENFHRALMRKIEEKKITWSIAGLEAVHAAPLTGGYYERAVRLRGEPAPREVAPFIPPTVTKPEPIRVNANIIDRDERARLKAVPIDELARQVRRGYKVERPQ